MSVLIPVRNGAGYVDEALASICGQSLRDIEIVVVDDRSTDATPALLERRAAGDGRIRVLAATGAGIVDALNQALAAASADIVARMDADDVAEPERLARQLAVMDARPDLVLLGSGAIGIGADGRAVGAIAVETDPARLVDRLRHDNPFLHPTVVMRRRAVEAAGGYRRPFALAEDYDLWIRMARQGVIANLPAPLIRLRRHPNQSSRRHRAEQRAVHALTRLLAYGPPVAAEYVAQSASSREAVGTYLRALVAAAPSLALRDRRDVEKMLRWYLAATDPARDERRAIAGLLRDGPPSLSSLLLRLRLRLSR